ncbi:ABC transporter permease [Streptomyces sp. TR02-1]|uniref:ABC transporter permease n=1 Tax=Streptomyces sp. TR02-1 TaxID=3385977 RepID=UPI0039A105D7
MTEFLVATRAVAGRHFHQLLRLPEKLIGFTVMPVAMVVGLGILFGGSMRVPGGGDYGAYVSAGVVSSIAVSLAALTALGVVDDLQNGMFDRLRSLPVDRSALLCGRIAVDALPLGTAMVSVVVAARVLGWPVTAAPHAVLAAMGLEVLLAMGCACLGVVLGLTLRHAEAVTAVVPVCLLPLTFLSDAFVPPGGLPGPLQAVVAWNPVTAVNRTVRELLGDTPSVAAAAPWPAQHHGLVAVAFCLALLALGVPAATRVYDRDGRAR